MAHTRGNSAQKGDEPTFKSSLDQVKRKYKPVIPYALLGGSAIALALLIVGSIKIKKCPVEKNIPIFMIVTGSVGIASKLVSYFRNRLSKHFRVEFLETPLYGVEVIMSLLGSYWVFKEFQPSYEPNDGDKYCDKGAYLFSFVYLILSYIFALINLLALFCAICCIICLCKACGGDCCEEESRHDRTAEARETKIEFEARS